MPITEHVPLYAPFITDSSKCSDTCSKGKAEETLETTYDCWWDEVINSDKNCNTCEEMVH